MVKFLGLLVQGLNQAIQLLLSPVKKLQGCNPSAGGKYIVGGLAVIYVIVGIYNAVISLLSAQNFNGPVGDYLVGVHIQRGSCASLDGIYDKLVVQLSLK